MSVGDDIDAKVVQLSKKTTQSLGREPRDSPSNPRQDSSPNTLHTEMSPQACLFLFHGQPESLPDCVFLGKYALYNTYNPQNPTQSLCLVWKGTLSKEEAELGQPFFPMGKILVIIYIYIYPYIYIAFHHARLTIC